MNTEKLDDLDAIAASVLQAEAKKKHALSLLLDEVSDKKDRLLVRSSFMGGTESYLGVVTLEWLANRVSFASQLPLFRQKLDANGKLLIDSDTIDEVMQRPLDHTRQSLLAQYLITRPKHKFPPVLVVVTQPWVDNPKADEWDSEGKAIRSSSEFLPLDSEGKHGLLDISDVVSIFALDGQHRLLGIQGLMELKKTGRLQKYKKNGEAQKGQVIELKDLEEIGIQSSYLHQLSNETIGVEFISAVVPGETRTDAKRRVRSIFVHVNRSSVQLTKGQIHLLDEDNGFALVAKRIAVSHPAFQGDDGGRLNWENNTISGKSQKLSTLQALTESVQHVLEHKYPHWKSNERNLTPLRPEDSELDDATVFIQPYFDAFAALPSIDRAIKGSNIADLRNFEDEGGGEGILLFRPVGQTALAMAVGVLLSQGKDLKTLFAKLNKYDVAGGFSHIDKSESHWYGVLYDQNRKRMLIANEKLASRLLVYLLNGGIQNEDEREKLRLAIAQTREIDEKYLGYDGNWTDHAADIHLPAPL